MMFRQNFETNLAQSAQLYGIQSGLAGADANGLLDIGHEDLAVADPSRLGGAPDRIDRALDQVVADHDLDFHLGQEVDDVFGAAIEFGMALLPSEALGLRHRDALQSNFLKCFLHLVELERLDDGFDLLHGAASRAFPNSKLRLRRLTRARRAQDHPI